MLHTYIVGIEYYYVDMPFYLCTMLYIGVKVLMHMLTTGSLGAMEGTINQ